MSGSSPVDKQLSSTDREQQRQEWLQNQDHRREQTDKDFQAGLDRDLHHSQVVSRDEPRAEHKDGKVVEKKPRVFLASWSASRAIGGTRQWRRVRPPRKPFWWWKMTSW
jgi:hypothetical protein